MIIQLEKELQGDNDDSYCLNVIAQEMRLLLAGVKGQKIAVHHSSLSHNLVDPNMKLIWERSEINGVKNWSNKQIKSLLYVLGKFISNLKPLFATKMTFKNTHLGGLPPTDSEEWVVTGGEGNPEKLLERRVTARSEPESQLLYEPASRTEGTVEDQKWL